MKTMRGMLCISFTLILNLNQVFAQHENEYMNNSGSSRDGAVSFLYNRLLISVDGISFGIIKDRTMPGSFISKDRADELGVGEPDPDSSQLRQPVLFFDCSNASQGWIELDQIVETEESQCKSEVEPWRGPHEISKGWTKWELVTDFGGYLPAQTQEFVMANNVSIPCATVPAEIISAASYGEGHAAVELFVPKGSSANLEPLIAGFDAPVIEYDAGTLSNQDCSELTSFWTLTVEMNGVTPSQQPAELITFRDPGS